MIDLCNINIGTLKQKLSRFEIHPKHQEDSNVIRFSAGGHEYEMKLKFVVYSFDGTNFVGANFKDLEKE